MEVGSAMCSSMDASTISRRVSINPCEASERPGFRVSERWLGSKRLIALEPSTSSSSMTKQCEGESRYMRCQNKSS